MAHGEITLPQLTADAIAEHTGTLEAVATALGAIEGHLVSGPGHAAGVAGAELLPQLLDRQYRVRVVKVKDGTERRTSTDEIGQ